MAVLLRLVLYAVTLCSTYGLARGAPDTTLISGICSTVKYQDEAPYARSVTYVLEDLLKVTPLPGIYNYNTSSPYPASPAYGHATCNSAIASSDCAMCLIIAMGDALNDCRYAMGVQFTLVDCRIRYEPYKF